MGFGISFIKYGLFLYNLLVAICGLVILGLGVAVKLKITEITRIIEGKINIPSILFIVIGSLIFIIAFFGCCGAICESHCMIVTYAMFLLINIIIQVVLVILVFVYYEKVVSDWLKHTFDEAQAGNEDAKETFDSMQRGLECCGYQSPHDYPLGAVPSSCCSGDGVSEQKAKGLCRYINSYKTGCVDAFKTFTMTAGYAIGCVAIGVAAVEIIGFIFALFFVYSKRNDYKRYR